jgi:RNA polymerase sigma-70 factor (ECF subfamily)
VEVALGSRNDARDDSFVAFFEAEYERLYRTLLLVVGSRSDADELAQEAMVRVYERWGQVREMESPAGYAYTVAFNLNRRRFRHRLRARRRLPDPEPTTSAEVIETRRDVRTALLRLPTPLREAIVLTEWLDLSTEEAGGILGIEAVSVRGRVHRARRLLRDLLEETHG